jgi:CBS domain-containing protein
MKIIDTISAVLNQKGAEVWSIPPDTTVFAAIQLMAERNIGALLVMQSDKLVGMFSERDYTRKVALKGKSSKQTSVKEIMASPIVTVTREHTVEECMRLMTDHRVRHLPVLEGEKVIGVISIGNLVNWIISSQNSTIDQLENYIAGQYPG